MVQSCLGRQSRIGSNIAGPRSLSGGGTRLQQYVLGQQRLATAISTQEPKCATAQHMSMFTRCVLLMDQLHVINLHR